MVAMARSSQEKVVVLRKASMRLARQAGAKTWQVLVRMYADFDRYDYLTYSAALAYYCLLSMFPLLVFLASLLALIPIPHLFQQTLEIMARIVPHDAMGLVRSVLRDALETDRRLLSLSIVGALFAASGGFSSLITTLNLAYGVEEGRPYWKTRAVACGLTVLTGFMAMVVLIAVAIGPEVGLWLAAKFHLQGVFVSSWPFTRWLVIGACTVFAVETIYFLGPNVRQRFKDQVPGATVAVASWIVASWGLGWYLARVANYRQIFGTLGAVVALMLWLYVSALSLLVGAEINSQWLRAKRAPAPVLNERRHAFL
jgi:membrane protein